MTYLFNKCSGTILSSSYEIQLTAIGLCFIILKLLILAKGFMIKLMEEWGRVTHCYSVLNGGKGKS